MTKIITLGPNGSFSSYGTQLFAQKTFDTFDLRLVDTFQDVWRNLLESKDIMVVLPIENSSTSNVHENIDFVFRHPEIEIVAEFFLPITLHLYGSMHTNLNDIATLYSHPKAFEQCEIFLRSFNGAIVEVKSTSDALSFYEFNNDPLVKIGFIGGPQLESLTTANVLQKNIANESHNVTRFLVLKQKNSDMQFNALKKNAGKNNKATLIFETFHEKGALAKVLTLISHLDGNLLKIESRPIAHKPQNYAFWIDIDLTGTPKNLIDILQKNVQDLRVVGRYEGGKKMVKKL